MYISSRLERLIPVPVAYKKVNRYVFFATNGCGDYYCYRVLANGETDASAIYLWEHELFQIREAAKDIVELITKYYNDEV